MNQNQTQLSNFTVIITAIMLTGSFFGSQVIAQKKSLEWHSFKEAIQYAEDTQKPILVDVWAPWCGWCKKMQKEVYPNLSEELSSQFVWTRLNRDDNDSSIYFKNQRFTPFRLAQKLHVQSVPTTVILSPQGEYIFHISGFRKAEKLEPLLQQISESL